MCGPSNHAGLRLQPHPSPDQADGHQRLRDMNAVCYAEDGAAAGQSGSGPYHHQQQQTLTTDPQPMDGLCGQLQLRLKDTKAHLDGLSPPLSPRSACSTPGRGSELPKQTFKHCLPARQYSNVGRQRYSHDVQRTPFSGNPWAAAGSSQGAGSAYSASSSGSIVHAIASLGLEGPRPAGGAAPAASRAAAATRGSISKAKKILAEAISSVPGAHGLASCASSASDTGVLSPLLTIIRNNGVVKATAGEGSGRSSRCASRCSSFSEAASGWSQSSLYSSSSSSRSRVSRRASFSEGAGGLSSADLSADSSPAASGSCCSSRTSSVNSPLPVLPVLPVPSLLSPAQQQQKVVDCLETVRYLAMDDSNRMALIDLGAVELLLTKLQPASSRGSMGGAAPAVMEAALSALAVLAKHDATKLRVWDNPHSAVLLQLLAQRHTSPVVKAAHLCVANLAWSIDMDRSCHASSGSSSVFDSVSSHTGRDDASTTSSSCGSTVLLTPGLIPAIATGLHPSAEVPVLLSLLKLLNKAASSSCLAPSQASSPCSSSRASDSSSGPLCTVQVVHSAAWKVGWQQAMFALPPLLVQLGHDGHSARLQPVLGAALEVLVSLTEQHPEFHAAVCAAGCLPPLLAVLLSGTTCSEHSLQAACALNALLDCPEAVQQLGQEHSLRLFLQVLGDSSKTVDVRQATLHMMRRLAAASHGCVDLLKLHGAVHTVAGLLQQVHTSEVKRAAMGLLQLLGKQVVVRPRKRGSIADSGSQRSSFESTSSAAASGGQHHMDAEARQELVQQLGHLTLQHHFHQAGQQQGQHRLASQQVQHAHAASTLTPCYLHAH